MERIEVGIKLREARKQKGYTQLALAEAVDVSEMYISQIERGMKMPSLNIFIKIITVLDISSDYVFGGGHYNRPCKEEQSGSPTGVYGFSKLRGEEAIKSSGVNYIIIRTSWMHSEFGKNFVKTMLKLTAEKEEVKVVFDQVGTPTYAYDLAKVISHIIETNQLNKKGIYHFSNEGVCSWYDFAKMIAQMAGHTECNILPCHSNEFPSKVIRPSYSVLDKTKIKETFGITIPYWVDSLRVCIDNLKGEK